MHRCECSLSKLPASMLSSVIIICKLYILKLGLGIVWGFDTGAKNGTGA